VSSRDEHSELNSENNSAKRTINSLLKTCGKTGDELKIQIDVQDKENWCGVIDFQRIQQAEQYFCIMDGDNQEIFPNSGSLYYSP